MRRTALQHLTAFFVYDPTQGGEEDEEEQILYFSPRTLSLDEQNMFVGLVTGLVNFASDFAEQDGKKASSLHTLKNRYAFVEVEPDIWITLIVKNPTKNPSDKDPEYLTEEVEDSVLQALLVDAYRTFSFFNGSIRSLLESDKEHCRRHLSLFFKYYLPTIPFNQLRFFADIYGFRFFPVDRSTYLSVQYLANCVSGQFPQLHSLSVIYSNRLLWSGLPQSAIRVLYTINQETNSNYIYGYLARCANGEEIKTNTRASRRKVNLEPDQSEFLVGPLKLGVHQEDCPKVFVDGKEYRLVALKLRALCLFWLLEDGPDAVQAQSQGTSDLAAMLQEVQEFVMPQSLKLLAELETHEKKQLDRDEQFRFLYFNHENLALKSILRSPRKKLSSETCRTLRNIHTDFERSNWKVTEVCVRCTDGWVMGRKSFIANRELYLLVDHHEASQLKDVKTQMDRLERTYFANIFFH